MNAYYIITQHEQPQYDAPPEVSLGLPTGYDFVGDMIFAETRGKARAIFANEYLRGWFVEPVSIKKVLGNVNRHAGIAQYDDILRMWINPGTWADGPFEDVADLIIHNCRDYPAAGQGDHDDL